jgi:hypothetical protein
MAHAQIPDFVFRRNGWVHLNRRGRQFSRLLAAEVCTSAVVMLDTPRSEVVWRVLATYSIRQFPPSLPPPVCHRVPSNFNWTLTPYDIQSSWRLKFMQPWVWLSSPISLGVPTNWVVSGGKKQSRTDTQSGRILNLFIGKNTTGCKNVSIENDREKRRI